MSEDTIRQKRERERDKGRIRRSESREIMRKERKKGSKVCEWTQSNVIFYRIKFVRKEQMV